MYRRHPSLGRQNADQVQRIGRTQHDKLAELLGFSDRAQPPDRVRRGELLAAEAGDEARVDEFIATLDNGAASARDIKAALDDGQAPSPELLQTYFGVVARGNELARAFGFRVCGLVS